MSPRVDMVLGLMSAYGFEISERHPEQNRIRLKSETTFIDFWYGRRGFTIGIYDPATSLMNYKHRVNEERVEEALEELMK